MNEHGERAFVETPDPAGGAVAGTPLVDIRHASRYFSARSGFFSPSGRIRAVENVSLRLFTDETVGLVGESGCGKSTLGRMAVGLLTPSEGEVRVEGRALLPGQPAAGRAQMVFQDPFSSLNPRLPVGISIAEPLTCAGVPGGERRRLVLEMLDRVGLSAGQYGRYPHQFSGGQRQRLAIARAIIQRPALVVCDEPVSSLDTSVQAQMLNLLKGLQRQFRLSYLFISHDLQVVGYMCGRIAVMYLGGIVEIAPRAALFGSPAHPYTRALLASAPTLSPRDRAHVPGMSGEPPNPMNPPAGCPFHPRCPEAFAPCFRWAPRSVRLGAEHMVRCHLHESWAG